MSQPDQKLTDAKSDGNPITDVAARESEIAERLKQAKREVRDQGGTGWVLAYIADVDDLLTTNTRLRGQLDNFRTRIFTALTAKGCDHTTACAIWGDNGRGGTAEGFKEPLPCTCGALLNFERKQRTKAEAELARVRQERDTLDRILREHYLFGIICDHAAKTDQAICACSKVALPVVPSVGEAVNSWVEHVFALAASSPPATVADERSVRSGSPDKTQKETQKERGEGAAE